MHVNIRLWASCLFAVALCLFSCRHRGPFSPVRSDEFPGDTSAAKRYNADEILVMYKGIPSPGKRDTIRIALEAAGVNTDSVTVRTCNSCGAYVELWQGADIHTVIHAEGIRAGTVSGGSKGVGEDSLARYSLNYIQHLPIDPLPSIRQYDLQRSPPAMNGSGKDTIIVAVLDTGVDTFNVVRSQYLWKNKEEDGSATDPDSNCYEKDILGWNFISNSPDIRDDNLNLHGSLVSKYILDEFETSGQNFVQMMVLKTHDDQGQGDLFSSICALHYAMDKGANIINASWGFYYYDSDPHPYLDSLITQVMKERGILFVTASGNKIDEVDAYAQMIYQEEFGVSLPESQLRNLEVHNFFPACLADSTNNVVVATTTNRRRISPTQNYSDQFVDFGVLADSVGPGFMRFRVPFTAAPVFISGSSFATAILAGKIGALANKEVYKTGLNKQEVINSILSGGSGVISTSPNLETNELVRNGSFV